MRIVHVVHVGGGLANIYGDQRHAFYLARTQLARGSNPAVLTYSAGLFSDLCEREGIPVFIVDPLHEDAPPRGDLSAAAQLAIKLRKFDAEVIHCHDLMAAKTVVAVANRIDCPCVITLHTGLVQIVPQLIAAKQSGMKFAIIAVCKKDFDFIQENDVTGIDFHYVPNGSRVSCGVRQQEQGGSCRPNLILVGGLEFRKGIDLAILAMFELRQRRGSDCPALNIYGVGRFGEYFSEMTRTLHLDDVVKFHGIEMDILDKCPSSDVLIVPSRLETGPLVVLEAMSRGMPIIAASVGEVNEMIPDQKYGRVVPVNSIAALADAIDSMLTDVVSGQFDHDLVIKRHQSQYSIEKMTDSVEAVYQSAVLG